jgi:hypothetical protein
MKAVRVIEQDKEKRSETSPIRRIYLINQSYPSCFYVLNRGTYVLDSTGGIESEVLVFSIVLE